MKRPDSVSGWDLRRLLVTSIAAASLAGIVLATLRGPIASTGDGLWPLSWLPWPVVGWMVLVRRPGNRIGQLCLGIGATMGLALGLQSMVLDVEPAVAAWIELTYTVLGIAPWLLIVAVLNTFPSGSYAGRAETILGRALIAVGSWALLGFLISSEPLSDTGLNNPLATPQLSGVAVITNESGFLLVVFLSLGALARLFVRARRSSGVERQQFRWLLLGGAVFVVVIGAGQFLPENSSASLLWVLGGWSIPTSIGVAVLRYRLFDIDRIISRTVTYTLVVGVLVAVYTAAVGVLAQVLPIESDLAVAAATVTAAALFNPLRRRIQRWVDRRFNRTRYVAERELETFTDRLRDTTEIDTVQADLLAVVHRTLQPSTMGVWIKGRSG
jgi:hypothetical protein